MSDIMNYQFQDPMQTFLRMSQFGSGIAQQREQGVTARINAEMLQAKLQAAEAEARTAAAQQEKIDELTMRLRRPGATRNDYLELAMFLPKDQAKAVQDSVAGMREEEQAAALNESAQIFSAFKGGRPDLAAQYIRRQAEAERGSGNEQGALAAEAWAKMAESEVPEDVEKVADMFGFQISLLPGGEKVFEAAAKRAEEQRAATLFPVLQQQKDAELRKANSEAEKQAVEAKYAKKIKISELKQKAADLGLTQAQKDKVLAETNNLSEEFANLMLENAAKEAHGGFTIKDVAALEDGLRKEVDSNGSRFNVIDSQYKIIKGASDTGPGDLARIFAFMKAIDPGSTVREGEQASAANAGGIPSSIWSIYNKAVGAGKLSPSLRAEFTREAAKLWQIEKSKYDAVLNRAETIIKNRKLNRANVFIPVDQAALPQQASAAAPSARPAPPAAPSPSEQPMEEVDL